MSQPVTTVIDGSKPDAIGVAGAGTTLKPIDSNIDGISGPKEFDAGIGIESFEPTTAAIPESIDGEPRRTRTGRPDRRTRAGRNAAGETAEGKHSLGIESLKLSDLLYSIHLGLAHLTIEEMELDREESKQYADALAEVAKHYAVAIDPRKLAIANLLAVAGRIYGPRILAYRLRKSMTEESKPATKKAPTPITPQPAGRGRNPAEVSPHELWSEPPGATSFTG